MPAFRLPGKKGCCGGLAVAGLLLAVVLIFVFLSNQGSQPENLPAQAPDNLPDWMQKALQAVSQPRYFKKGAAGLVELCCRSPEHVARSIKARLGRTPSQVVNDARLEYAVRELTLSDRSIYAIALECGYESLSYFYRQFRTRLGMSPAAFRRNNRRIIG